MNPRPSRNENGLTTLEWLLIVAAVAGLAALAVVLVQNVVDDTAEQIAGSSARITAAQVAADAITNDDDRDEDKRSACNRLDITYSDAFQEDPSRTSLWTDKDTTEGGGVCAIVTEAIAAVVESQTAATCDGTGVSDNGLNDKPAAERGGRTFVWTPGATGDKCHLEVS